jgi:hypothetical protein
MCRFKGASYTESTRRSQMYVKTMSLLLIIFKFEPSVISCRCSMCTLLSELHRCDPRPMDVHPQNYLHPAANR